MEQATYNQGITFENATEAIQFLRDNWFIRKGPFWVSQVDEMIVLRVEGSPLPEEPVVLITEMILC
jgi:hypothetical protein